MIQSLRESITMTLATVPLPEFETLLYKSTSVQTHTAPSTKSH